MSKKTLQFIIILILPVIMLGVISSLGNAQDEAIYLLKDLNPGSDGSGPAHFTNVNGILFFRANEGTHGTELWKSDGTTAGTIMVKDINPGGNSMPHELTNVNGTLFFMGKDGTHGTELWKSDGTTAGTVMVKDILPGSAGGLGFTNIVNINGNLFFSAGDGTHGLELWKSDGTTAGTVMVKDIRPSLDPALSNARLTNVNDTLFFTAWDGAGNSGYELWKSDGTAGGTIQVTNIFVGGNISPRKFTNVNDTLFFEANDGTQGTRGTQLWKSDGTTAGTVMVKDFNPGYDGSSLGVFANVDGTLFFEVFEVLGPFLQGRELWKSDGTTAGTVMIKDFSSNGGSLDTFFANINGTLFFNAGDGTHGLELWKSDGTTAGTVMLKDINPGSDGSRPSLPTNVNGTLFFVANDGTHGSEMWQSDGTVTGTIMVKDINPGSDGSGPAHFTNVNGILFFRANEGTHGTELWVMTSPLYSISGQVTDTSNNPIQGVTISAGSSLGTTTDSSGSYAFTNVSTGTYTLVPAKTGYMFSPPSSMINLPPDTTQDFVGSPSTGPGPKILSALTIPPIVEMRHFYKVFGTVSEDGTPTSPLITPVDVTARETSVFPLPNDVPAPTKTVTINVLSGFPAPYSIHGYQHSWDWMTGPFGGSCLDPWKMVADKATDFSKYIKTTWVKYALQGGKALLFLIADLVSLGMVHDSNEYIYVVHAKDQFGEDFENTSVRVEVPAYKQDLLKAYIALGFASDVVSILATLLPDNEKQLSGWGAAAKFAGCLSFDIAKDPDPNYTIIAMPEPISLPSLEAIPDSTGKELALAWVQALVDLEVLGRSFGRYEGAKEAGDQKWMVRQLKAAQDYNAMLIQDLSRVQSLTTALISELEAQGVTLTDADLAAAHNLLLTEGLPQLQQDILNELGFTPEEITTIATNTAGHTDLMPLEWQGTISSSVEVMTEVGSNMSDYIDQRIDEILPNSLYLPVVVKGQ